MSGDFNISVSITPTWSIVKEIQQKSENFMRSKNHPIDLIEATMMCVSELIENAIKYGTETPGNGNIELDLTSNDKEVSIKVANGIKSRGDVQSVMDHIDKLKKGSDASKLYTERLMELMDNPKPGVSQLGLYRIAYEGEFKLDYTYENNVLTVTAIRKI